MRADCAGVCQIFCKNPELAQTVPFGGSLVCNVRRAAQFTGGILANALTAAPSGMQIQWKLPSPNQNSHHPRPLRRLNRVRRGTQE
jgi:hypothetical protein